MVAEGGLCEGSLGWDDEVAACAKGQWGGGGTRVSCFRFALDASVLARVWEGDSTELQQGEGDAKGLSRRGLDILRRERTKGARKESSSRTKTKDTDRSTNGGVTNYGESGGGGGKKGSSLRKPQRGCSPRARVQTAYLEALEVDVRVDLVRVPLGELLERQYALNDAGHEAELVHVDERAEKDVFGELGEVGEGEGVGDVRERTGLVD